MPVTTKQRLEKRARMFHDIRVFFAERQVLEVDTPLLYASTATDPHLDSFCLEAEPPLFLQTSPEFPMKRLLAEGSGDIYQLGKVFRKGELGSQHRPEFTMLEWYRQRFSLQQLMEEVVVLIKLFLPSLVVRTMTYREVFFQEMNFDPFAVDLTYLQSKASEVSQGNWAQEKDKDVLLDFLMTHCVEKTLFGGVFITEYPASQASLATTKTDEEGNSVAQRFEFYIDGLELANGYKELRDADLLRQRFAVDNENRQRLGKRIIPEDEELLNCLGEMPECSGVALGVDRLLMKSAQVVSIGEVTSIE